MSTFLWDSIAFGPIHSRRLGNSLGINLLPTEKKICTFNCLYCECGWTLERDTQLREHYPLDVVLSAIEHKLRDCKLNNQPVDSITFSGNGEPTLYPYFDKVIDKLIDLRNEYYPEAVISCLSNSTQLIRPEVLAALKRIENPIMKLDAGSQELLDIVNFPVVKVDIEEVTRLLCEFNGKLVLQTLFFCGEKDGKFFDNAADAELAQWFDRVKVIAPERIMIYSLDRETPALNLRKYDKDFLDKIVAKLQAEGFSAVAY